MCDNPDRPASAMAAHLQAVHRWAVTGTPMSHDLRDMHGLLTFLRAEPLAGATARGVDVYGEPLLRAAPAWSLCCMGRAARQTCSGPGAAHRLQ